MAPRARTGRSGRSRGEINEVISQLTQLSALDGRKPDVVRAKRECLQRLIRHMTAGIDMSAAFIPATKCVALSKSDLPLKKMLYWYLRSAARQNAEVALLVVQALTTDAKDPDPAIRGLALRSICSLRVPNLMDTVFDAVETGLRDGHPYVREVAVIGVLKCHEQDPNGAQLRGFMDTVRSILSTDADPQVIANCLYVLQTLGVLSDDAISRPLVVSLLNHVRSFSDWAQCLVLDMLLRHYRPSSEAERFDMLEILDFGLNHTNSAVVLATAKLFLHYTDAYPDQHAQVLASIRAPLQTLLLGRESEVAFAALSNIIVLAERHPGSFKDLAEDLFCRPEDPTYLKLLKLEALVTVAEASSAYDAAEEASQYARDQENDVARAAVRTVARIALKVAEVDGILDRLLLFLTHPRTEVAGEAVAVMADVLRRFPDAAEACISAVVEADEAALQTPHARAAYAWILGEFGEKVQDAPYALETMIDRFAGESTQVKLALLTAAGQLFFKRPPECHAALGAALAAGAQDEDAAVRDRARLYYRLLKLSGPDGAKQVISAPRPPVARFEEAQPAEVRDRIFDEWNSLSAIYKAPASTFITQDNVARTGLGDADSFGAGNEPAPSESDASAGADGGIALLLDVGDGGQDESSSSVGGGAFAREEGSVAVSGPSESASAVDLLAELGDVGHSSVAMPTASPLPAPAASVRTTQPSGGSVVDVGEMDLSLLLGGHLGGSVEPIPAALGSSLTEASGMSTLPQDPTTAPTSAAPTSSAAAMTAMGNPLGGSSNAGGGGGGLGMGRRGELDMFGGLLNANESSNGNRGMNVVVDLGQLGERQHNEQSQLPTGSGGLDDLLGGLYGGGNTVHAPTGTDAGSSHATGADVERDGSASITLVENPSISQQEFQHGWSCWNDSALTFRQDLGPVGVTAIQARNFKDFKNHVGQANISVFAAPREGSVPPLRFLLHAQRRHYPSQSIGQERALTGRILAQVSVSLGAAEVVVKSDDPRAAAHVKEVLQTLLMTM